MYRAAVSLISDMETEPSIRVLLVDDHELIREGLIFVLKDEKDIEVS